MTVNHFVQFEQARLLVVDDDPIMREFAVANLSSDKVEVVSAADGSEAFYRLQRGPFDIALVDLDMPVMDGFELIGLVRGDPELKHFPLVIATGREDMSAVDRAFAAGATSFVVKPLNWRLISHQLSYVLKASREEALVRQTLNALQRANLAHGEILTRAIRRLETVAEAPQPSDIQRLMEDLTKAAQLLK